MVATHEMYSMNGSKSVADIDMSQLCQQSLNRKNRNESDSLNKLNIKCHAMCWYEDKQGFVTTTTNLTRNDSAYYYGKQPEISECPSKFIQKNKQTNRDTRSFCFFSKSKKKQSNFFFFLPFFFFSLQKIISSSFSLQIKAAIWKWNIGWQMKFPQITLPGEMKYRSRVQEIQSQANQENRVVSYKEEMEIRKLAQKMQELRPEFSTVSERKSLLTLHTKKRKLKVTVIDQAGNKNYVTKIWTQKPGTMPLPPKRPNYQGPRAENPSSPNAESMQIIKNNERDFTLTWKSTSDVRSSAYGVPMMCNPILINSEDPSSGHPDDYGERCDQIREKYRSTNYLVWWTASNNPFASTVLEKIGKPADIDSHRGQPVYLRYALTKALEHRKNQQKNPKMNSKNNENLVWYMENATCPTTNTTNNTKCDENLDYFNIPITSRLVQTNPSERGEYDTFNEFQEQDTPTAKGWLWSKELNMWVQKIEGQRRDLSSRSSRSSSSSKSFLSSTSSVSSRDLATTYVPVRHSPLFLKVNRKNTTKRLVDIKIMFSVALVPKLWEKNIQTKLIDSDIDNRSPIQSQYFSNATLDIRNPPQIPSAVTHKDVWTTTYDCMMSSKNNNEGSYLHRRDYERCSDDCGRGEMKICPFDNACYSTTEPCPGCGDTTNNEVTNNDINSNNLNQDNACACANQYSNPQDSNSFGRLVMLKENEEVEGIQKCNMSNTTKWDGNDAELSMYNPKCPSQQPRCFESNRKQWHCRKCPLGASCTGTRTGEEVGVRFGYWKSYWNSSVILPCDVPEACLGK